MGKRYFNNGTLLRNYNFRYRHWSIKENILSNNGTVINRVFGTEKDSSN